MNKKQARITIARDVMARIKAGTLKAKRAVYLDVPGVESWQEPTKEQMAQKNCKACALGSMLVCATTAGHLNPDGQHLGSDAIHELLGKYFSRQQMADIEGAFEGKRYEHVVDSDLSSKEALKFNKGVGKAKDRLARIMRNIIRNEGTFVP